MPPKGGGGGLGMSATLPCTWHLTNRLQDVKTAVICGRLCGLCVRWKSMAVLPVFHIQGSLPLCAYRRCSQSQPRARHRHCPTKNGPRLTRTYLSTFLSLAGNRVRAPQAPHCVHGRSLYPHHPSAYEHDMDSRQNVLAPPFTGIAVGYHRSSNASEQGELREAIHYAGLYAHICPQLVRRSSRLSLLPRHAPTLTARYLPTLP